MTRHLSFVLVVVVLLAVIAAVWAVWRGARETEPVEEPVVETPGDVGTFSIYTNGAHGFSILYPEDARLEEAFDPEYHVPNTWRVNALPDVAGTPILALVTFATESENSYPRYYTAQVRIGASSDPREVERCTQPAPEQGETQLADVTLGDTTFSVFSFQSAGMMQYAKGESYRTVHQGLCYAIERIAAGSSYREDPPSPEDIPEEVLEAEYAKLADIIRSFSFARP